MRKRDITNYISLKNFVKIIKKCRCSRLWIQMSNDTDRHEVFILATLYDNNNKILDEYVLSKGEINSYEKILDKIKKINDYLQKYVECDYCPF